METQTKKKASKQEAIDKLEALKDEFKNVQKTPLTRWVILEYQNCCGCGCNTTKIKRKVPYDSPLIDGALTRDLEKGDIPI